MGLFDDNKYVAKVSKQFSSNGQNDKWLKEVLTSMTGLSKLDEASVKKSIEDGKLNASNYKASIKRITQLKESYVEQTEPS